MEWMVNVDDPGRAFLMQGNEAFVRGALEAGVRFAASYPGSPSAEIITMLGHLAKDRGLYAEWSDNEIVALQACMGASMSGVRSLCVVKQNGMLVIGDALHSAALSGCKGGVVLIVADDPSAHSSTNEFDSRHQARSANLPMLEPATFQEAKDMMLYAFDLSEELRQVVLVRGVTRIHHGRGNVTLGELPKQLREPKRLVPGEFLLAHHMFGDAMLYKLTRAGEKFETAPFNWYVGPDQPELIILCSGTGWFYSQEALELLGLGGRVGILKLGCTWPMPEQFVAEHLAKTSRVLVVEEVDPFVEQNLCLLVANDPGLKLEIFGRHKAKAFSMSKEMNVDRVTAALIKILGLEAPTAPSVETRVSIPPRELTFCAGCPHRATFYVLKHALDLLGGGVVMNDIGCYTIGITAGYGIVNGLSCMGGGINMAEGLGQLSRFGFDQPVVAMAGDSTFFHTCLPGLVSSAFHNSNMLFVVLDNSATAMTGFQPHPGTGLTAMGETAVSIEIEKVASSMGCSVTVADPYQIDETIEVVYDLLKKPGMKVLVMRQTCATLAWKNREKQVVYVDPDLCRGESCGCNRYCSRVWGCPANIWDYETGKAKIDEVVCVGCGVCVGLCPAGAIKIGEGTR
jgi:indolepyruvate ferredoxin oxidoreductase alpha subunit